MSVSAQIVPVRRYPLARLRAPGLHAWAGGLLAVLVIVAALAPLLTPFSPDSVDLTGSLAGPNPTHLLGLDGAGRDILSRLIVGTRTSLGGPALVVVFSAALGVPMGLLAGYRRGLTDGVLGRIWDVMLAFPSLLLAILVVAAFGKGFWTAGIAVGLTYVPFMARIARGLALAEREKPYVVALELQGLSSRQIVVGHVVPNIRPALVSQLAVNFGYALLDLAALAFIGLGVQAPTPDWGVMLAEAKTTLLITSNPAIWPALAVVVTVIAANVLGEAIAERGSAS